MTAPASVVLEFKAQTYAAAGSQATLAGDLLGLFSGIISPDGDTFYYYIGTGVAEDFNMADISDPANPSDEGKAAVLNGLVGNEAVTSMAFDSTGQYLYVPDGIGTKLYTLDVSVPLVPTLAHTLTVTTAATDNRHVLVRDGSTLYLMGDSAFQKIDISTPQTPSVTSTVSGISGTIGAGVTRAYVTPDGDYVAYPEMNTGTPAGQIGLMNISGTPADAQPIDLPDFAGALTITVSGSLNFDSTINASRMWFVGAYTSGNNTPYFWVVYDKGTRWEDAVLISDPVTSGLIAPTQFLSISGGAFAPAHDSIAHGVMDSKIVVEKTRSTSGEGAYISFWELDANEIFPLLVIKEGDTRAEQLASGNTASSFFRAMDIQSSLLVGIVQYQVVSGDTTAITGRVSVHVPATVTTTDSGWQDISSDVNLASSPISVGSLGITGSRVTDRTAASGGMRFRLNNFNPAGQYSPGHTSQVTGFEIGAPIRLQISGTSPTPLKTKFLGRIESIKPGITRDGDLFVSVGCVDSVDVLSKAKAKGFTVRTSITAKRIVEAALNATTGLPLTPNATDSLDDTSDVYDFAFDGIEDEDASIVSEIQKAIVSERGFFYFAYQNSLVGTDGGFRFESRSTRINSPVFATAADGALLRALIPEHSAKVVYNRVRGRVFPREQDGAASTILFTLQNTPKLEPGEKIIFTAPYTDPSEQASRASATEMQPPIANTDYKFTGSEDGGGTDLVANLTVNIDFGGSSAEVTLQNIGPPGFVSLFQLKGRGLYSYEPLTATDRDTVSIVQHGLSDITFDLPHQEEISVAKGIVSNVLAAYAQPRTFIKSARLVVSKSVAALDAFLDGEIGDKYFVENDVLGVNMGTTSPFVLETSQLDGTDELADEAAVYAIHSTAFTVGKGNHIEATWGLFPADVRL